MFVVENYLEKKRFQRKKAKNEQMPSFSASQSNHQEKFSLGVRREGGEKVGVTCRGSG